MDGNTKREKLIILSIIRSIIYKPSKCNGNPIILFIIIIFKNQCVVLNIVFIIFSCQFIVREGEDYSICLKNPDALVEWDYIEQIVSTRLRFAVF